MAKYTKAVLAKEGEDNRKIYAAEVARLEANNQAVSSALRVVSQRPTLSEPTTAEALIELADRVKTNEDEISSLKSRVTSLESRVTALEAFHP